MDLNNVKITLLSYEIVYKMFVIEAGIEINKNTTFDLH